MNSILHADDIGLSPHITQTIWNTYLTGSLQRVSIIPNGFFFLETISFLQQNPNLDFAIHLNLVEGKALSPSKDIPLLVDKDGYFKNSFFTLWLKTLFFRKKILAQIKKELSLQIQRVQQYFPEKRIFLDSHQHTHLIPAIYRILLSLKNHYPIQNIRLIEEPFYLSTNWKDNIKLLFSLNLAKWILLRIFTKINILYTQKKEKNFSYPFGFMGVLFTNAMSIEVIKSGLKKMRNKKKYQDKTIEILLHPGRSTKEEKALWGKHTKKWKYYASPQREKEYQLLLSDKIKSIVTEEKK